MHRARRQRARALAPRLLLGGRHLVGPAACALCVVGCLAAPQDAPPVSPQRPTFSSDTATTPAGVAELELGATLDPDDALVVPASLKYGLSDRTELSLNLAAYQLFASPGEDAEGLGDTVVAVRHRAWEGDATSVAFRLGTKLPTADSDEGLGTGELDFFAAGIVTHLPDHRSALTGYWELGILGDPTGPGTDSQDLLALAGSRSFAHGVGIFGELARLVLPGGLEPVIATVGATKSFGPGLVLDLGLGLGVNDDAPDTQLIVGLTRSLGRVAN